MNSSNQKFSLQNCPYLGLHDDQRTSLAYPSAWNYCFRARPSASVSISHQIAACLSPEYIHCPVYLAVQDGTLPANLRGSSSAPTRHRKSARRKLRRMAWSVVIIILLIMAFILGQRFFPSYFESWFSPNTTSSLATTTVRADSTNYAQIGTIPSHTATGSPPQASFTATPVPLKTGTPTHAISLTKPGFTPIIKRCGYTLDTPFGADVKFTLHQIASGENLDKLTVRYQTTVDAIRAVNFSLPIPIWENSILVIPIGVSDVTGVPSFEPYRADGTIFSLEELALKLSADAQALLKYNAFSDSCTIFKGWLIVPRAAKTP
jgi:hypothetical protein